MPKINQRYFFLIFPIVILFSMTLATASIFAQETVSVSADGRIMGIDFKPQVPIPNFITNPKGTITIEGDGSTLYKYIIALYNYGASVAGLVAMFMIVLAGLKWLMAAGNPEKIATAKDMIQGAVLGLILLFGSYLLLVQISSRLVTFTGFGIEEGVRRLDVNTMGTCAQEAKNHPCGQSFVVKDINCPGGLKCTDHLKPHCAYKRLFINYYQCTTYYMMLRVADGKKVDCGCLWTSQELNYQRGP